MTENAMVGIVLISHSRAIAEGAADVAAQVSAGAVRVVGVGGTDDGRLGTSIDALSSAVDKVSAGVGVVVIPDLGSAVLTVKAYLADVDTSTSASSSRTPRSSRAPSRRPSRHRPALRSTRSSPPRREPVMSASSEPTAEVYVVLPADLHARPAGQVTKAATGYDAQVWLATETRDEVDARSVLAVMGLGAVAGESVRVRASGPQAAEAVAAVSSVLSAAEAVAG